MGIRVRDEREYNETLVDDKSIFAPGPARANPFASLRQASGGPGAAPESADRSGSARRSPVSPPPADPCVLVIVPAHQEAANVGRVVADVRHHVPAADVVVVDDGSTDRTAAVAADAGAAVLRLPFNLGVGAAMQTGFRMAVRDGYDIAVQLDGDGQHPAEELPTVLEPVATGRVDVAVGSRYLDPLGYVTPAGRRAGQRFFSRLVSGLTAQRFTDTTSGFRAYSRPAFSFLATSYSRDYPEVNALVALCQHGFRVTEVAVAMRDRQGGTSHITTRRAIFYMLKVSLSTLMTAVRLRSREGGQRRLDRT